jgi:hypothetical protein
MKIFKMANKCRYACKNLVGSFMCICPEGYREVGIDQCVGKYNNVGIVHGPFGFLFSSPGADRKSNMAARAHNVF